MRHLALLFALAAAGCGTDSSDSQPNTGGGPGSGGAAGSAGSGGSGGVADAGGGCSNDASAGARCVKTISGRVVDEQGQGLPKLLMSVCGPVCYYGESDSSGGFKVEVNTNLNPAEYSTLPHGRPDRTNFYFQLPGEAVDDYSVGDLLTLPLPSGGESLVVKSDKNGAPAQNVTHGGVTLDVPAGMVVKLDVEDIALGADGKLFRALAIDAKHQPAFADPSEGLLALYALTPFEVSFRDDQGKSAKARLSFPTPAGLAPNDPVEVVALGSYLYPDWVAPARFETVALGKVSADGTRVEMDPGEGIEYLTWVGLRKKL